MGVGKTQGSERGSGSGKATLFGPLFFFLPVLYWIPCTAPTPTTMCPSPLQQFIHSVAYYPPLCSPCLSRIILLFGILAQEDRIASVI